MALTRSRYALGYEVDAVVRAQSVDTLESETIYKGSISDAIKYAETWYDRQSCWGMYASVWVSLEQPTVSVPIILASYVPKDRVK